MVGQPLVWDCAAMELDVTDVVALVGAPTALYQLWQVRRGNQGTYEQRFVDRYWQIDDDLLSSNGKTRSCLESAISGSVRTSSR